MVQVLTEAEAVVSTAPTFDFSTIDFSTFGQTFVAALGVTIGVSIGYIAIRKGWSMIKKALKGA